MVSHGRIREIEEEVASLISNGDSVLEIGCKTGELASLMIARGANVEGFDDNSDMVRGSERRIHLEGLDGRFYVSKSGVEFMDELPGEDFDVVVGLLVFSELNEDERRFALIESARVLKPSGKLVIADEVSPRSIGLKVVRSMIRAPRAAYSFLSSNKRKYPLKRLADEIASVGLAIEEERRSRGDSFAIIIARKSEEKRQKKSTPVP